MNRREIVWELLGLITLTAVLTLLGIATKPAAPTPVSEEHKAKLAECYLRCRESFEREDYFSKEVIKCMRGYGQIALAKAFQEEVVKLRHARSRDCIGGLSYENPERLIPVEQLEKEAAEIRRLATEGESNERG